MTLHSQCRAAAAQMIPRENRPYMVHQKKIDKMATHLFKKLKAFDGTANRNALLKNVLFNTFCILFFAEKLGKYLFF